MFQTLKSFSPFVHQTWMHYMSAMKKKSYKITMINVIQNHTLVFLDKKKKKRKKKKEKEDIEKRENLEYFMVLGGEKNHHMPKLVTWILF